MFIESRNENNIGGKSDNVKTRTTINENQQILKI